MALECQYDGTTVRFIGALGAPLLPLLVLAACAVLEMPFPSKGINAALKAQRGWGWWGRWWGWLVGWVGGIGGIG